MRRVTSRIAGSSSQISTVSPALARRTTATGSSVCSGPSVAGSRMMKQVPWPGSELICTSPPALRDDPVHGGQAQPRPLALGFGREEGLERAGGDVRRHARAGVGHADPDVATRRQARRRCRRSRRCRCVKVMAPPPGMASRAFTARFTSTCSNCAGSAVTGHRSSLRRAAQLHVLAERAAEHPVHVVDHRVQGDHPRPGHLPAPEGQQLVGQRDAPVGGPLDLLDVAGYRVPACPGRPPRRRRPPRPRTPRS